MKKRSMPASNIGIISLIMTFILVCLVLFAILTLSQANSTHQYSTQYANSTSSYQEACNEATIRVADVKNIVSDCYKQNADSFVADALEILDEDQAYDVNFNENTVSFNQPMTDAIICVTLTLDKNVSVGADPVTITSWKKVSTAAWNTDDSVRLYQDSAK